MKGNIKKLAVFMMIAAIAMFTVVPMASADPPFLPALRGQYGATGGGTSLLAPLGFGSNLIPNGPPGAYVSQTCSVEGVYTFERDGTGSFEGLFHCTTLSYTRANPNPPPPTITYLPAQGLRLQHSYFTIPWLPMVR